MTYAAVTSCRLYIKPAAAKELGTLPRKNLQRIVAGIRRLAAEPRPSACEKISGHELCRFRQGKHRVIYSIQDAGLVVLVIATAPPRAGVFP